MAYSKQIQYRFNYTVNLINNFIVTEQVNQRIHCIVTIPRNLYNE